MSTCSHRLCCDPLLFEEYFEQGQDETSSPFLTPSSRPWGAHLSLKASLVATGFLILAFILSFFEGMTPLSYLFLTCVYFLAGTPFLIESINDLADFEINIDILMTFAAFSSALIGSPFEGGLLLVLFALSGAMEEYVLRKAKTDISNLHSLAPTKACLVRSNGTVVERSVKDISVNNHILIKSSQLVPLDGVVIDGVSSVNLVHLTGESLPVRKQVGDEVPAGARNLEGSLTIRVTRTSNDSTLAKIIQLVTEAQEERPALQRWFDRLSKGYAIAIMSLAACFALIFPLLMPIPYLGVGGSIYRALAFLIAASPCALIIAMPISYLSAVGACARKGILPKGSIALDMLNSCTAIAFDKTGTLTTGDLNLTGIEPIGPVELIGSNQALAVACALEKHAVHPIAKALTAYAKQHPLPGVTLRDFRAVPGYGLEAIVDDLKVFIGHIDYILPEIEMKTQELLNQEVKTNQERGELVAVLLIGSQLFLLRFEDNLRPNVKEALNELREQGMRLIMLTGDHEHNARRIAKELGIDEYYADLRPEDKLHYVSQISSKENLAMVGDGINDAPALARATVGICMGKIGSTAAIDAADIVLLQDNIELLGWLTRKARKTQRIVQENLLLASLAILLVSLPALTGAVPLWLAVVMHEGGTVLVGLNGLRLLKKG